MIVDLTLRTEEKDESLVIEKVLEISRHIKQVEFKIDALCMAETRFREKEEIARKLRVLMENLDSHTAAVVEMLINFVMSEIGMGSNFLREKNK